MEKLNSTECSYFAADGINDNVITVKSCVEHGRNYSELGDNVSLIYLFRAERSLRYVNY